MKYIYQENGDDIEVLLETEDGFGWICDCGLKTEEVSWEKAKMITQSLNGNLFSQRKMTQLEEREFLKTIFQLIKQDFYEYLTNCKKQNIITLSRRQNDYSRNH